MQGSIPFDADAEDEYNFQIKMCNRQIINSILRKTEHFKSSNVQFRKK